jgi:hypothetical protein
VINELFCQQQHLIGLRTVGINTVFLGQMEELLDYI